MAINLMTGKPRWIYDLPGPHQLEPVGGRQSRLHHDVHRRRRLLRAARRAPHLAPLLPPQRLPVGELLREPVDRRLAHLHRRALGHRARARGARRCDDRPHANASYGTTRSPRRHRSQPRASRDSRSAAGRRASSPRTRRRTVAPSSARSASLLDAALLAGDARSLFAARSIGRTYRSASRAPPVRIVLAVRRWHVRARDPHRRAATPSSRLEACSSPSAARDQPEAGVSDASRDSAGARRARRGERRRPRLRPLALPAGRRAPARAARPARPRGRPRVGSRHRCARSPCSPACSSSRSPSAACSGGCRGRWSCSRGRRRLRDAAARRAVALQVGLRQATRAVVLHQRLDLPARARRQARPRRAHAVRRRLRRLGARALLQPATARPPAGVARRADALRVLPRRGADGGRVGRAAGAVRRRALARRPGVARALPAALLFPGPRREKLALGVLLAANPIVVRAAWFGTADAPTLLLLVLAFALVLRRRPRLGGDRARRGDPDEAVRARRRCRSSPCMLAAPDRPRPRCARGARRRRRRRRRLPPVRRRRPGGALARHRLLRRGHLPHRRLRPLGDPAQPARARRPQRRVPVLPARRCSCGCR